MVEAKNQAVAGLCGVRHPVFLAGMAAISGPRLVAAVANAGGMGVLGGLRLPPRMLRHWIRETRALTDRPFGVNLVPQFGGPAVFEAQFQVVLQERPRLLSLFYAEDYGADMIPRAKAAGLVYRNRLAPRPGIEGQIKDSVAMLAAELGRRDNGR